jgi:hypothetical protein
MIEAMKQALEALERIPITTLTIQAEEGRTNAMKILRTAIAEAEKKKMPITDDHGKAIHDQRRVVEQKGNWKLIYDQHQIGNKVVHEFRIQKLRHDIVLYPGITLEEAKQRFSEKVEADNE